MDKYELVLDIIGHPEKYTADRLAEIMSDPETREIYNLICKADSAVEAGGDIDVDAEWDSFSRKHHLRPRRFLKWTGSRAASITAIICTSVAAVAAGIAVTVAVTGHRTEPMADSGDETTDNALIISSDSIPLKSDTAPVDLTPVMFEDEPLEAIMDKISGVYGVEVKFDDKSVASLHLYYKLDPSLPLDEVVSQLNTFEQINIRHNGNTLTID